MIRRLSIVNIACTYLFKISEIDQRPFTVGVYIYDNKVDQVGTVGQS